MRLFSQEIKGVWTHNLKCTRKYNAENIFPPPTTPLCFQTASFYHGSKKLSTTCLKKQQRGFGISYQGEKLRKILQVTKVCSETWLAHQRFKANRLYVIHTSANPPRDRCAANTGEHDCHATLLTPPASN